MMQENFESAIMKIVRHLSHVRDLFPEVPSSTWRGGAGHEVSIR